MHCFAKFGRNAWKTGRRFMVMSFFLITIGEKVGSDGGWMTRKFLCMNGVVSRDTCVTVLRFYLVDLREDPFS